MKNKKKSNGYVARFTITIRVGAVAFLLAALFIVLFLCLPSEKEFLKFVAGTIAAAAAVTSAFYIGQNLKQSNASEKLNRTTLYTNQWNNPNFFNARKAYREIMAQLLQKMEQKQEGGRLKVINELIDEVPDREQNLTNVLNFFEEMAVLTNKGIIDEEVIEEIYHTEIIRCYSQLEPWIKELRSKRGERIFGDLKKLYERWSIS